MVIARRGTSFAEERPRKASAGVDTGQQIHGIVHQHILKAAKKKQVFETGLPWICTLTQGFSQNLVFCLS